MVADRITCRGCSCQEVGSARDASSVWFYVKPVHIRSRLVSLLRREQVSIELDGDFVRVHAVVSAAQIIKLAAASLNRAERDLVKVVEICAGADPFAALIEGESLNVASSRSANNWFADLLASDALYMKFQPIVALNRRKIVANEALVRGRRGDTEISGGELVELAAQMDLLVALDGRTRIMAIEQFAATPLPGNLFVNFQPSAIYNPEFCLRTTFAAIERSRLTPADIVFEVVESEDILDFDHLKSIVDIYRAHGIRVAMDDVGSGRSSFDRLLQLRPDFVKVDKSIISRIALDPVAAMMAESIVRIAEAADCHVIAEGIETCEQLRVARDLGIEMGQGYLFARPDLLPTVNWPD